MLKLAVTSYVVYAVLVAVIIKNMTQHILPINDIEPHEEATTCKCKPKVEFIDGNMIVIHNSFDGRERQEELISSAFNNCN
jgi:hypothetical protein